MRRSDATCFVIRRPPGPPSGSGSVSCVRICVRVSMTSCRGGVWAARVCCCASQRCHRSTSARTKPRARSRALGSPQSTSSAALRLLCPTSVSPASSTSASADVSEGLQERGEGRQPRFHRLVASKLRASAVGQRVLKICVEQVMAMLTQKYKKLPRLAGACGYFLLFRGQHDGRVPHNGLLTV